MEILLFLAVCFVIWKVVDSIGSKEDRRDTVRRNTVITDDGRKRTVRTEISEEFVRGTAHGSLNLQNTPVGLPDEDITGYTKTLSPEQYDSHLAKSNSTSHLSDSQMHTARLMGRDPSIQPPPSADVAAPRHIQNTSSGYSQLTTKRCGKCGKSKPVVSEFFRSTKQPDGFSVWCRSCHDAAKQKNEKESRHYKRCLKCGNRRLRTNFGKSDHNPDGLTKWCLPCLKMHNCKDSR